MHRACSRGDRVSLYVNPPRITWTRRTRSAPVRSAALAPAVGEPTRRSGSVAPATAEPFGSASSKSADDGGRKPIGSASDVLLRFRLPLSRLRPLGVLRAVTLTRPGTDRIRGKGRGPCRQVSATKREAWLHAGSAYAASLAPSGHPPRRPVRRIHHGEVADDSLVKAFQRARTMSQGKSGPGSIRRRTKRAGSSSAATKRVSISEWRTRCCNDGCSARSAARSCGSASI